MRNSDYFTPTSIEQRKVPPGTFTRKLLLLLASSNINHQQIIMTMDKFAVLKRIGDCAPMVDNTFNNVTDATAYANIMRRKNDGWEYAVYQLNEEL